MNQKNKREYTDLKKKAICFRKKGWSYGEIHKELNVSKSTLSYWLKDFLLSPEQRKRFYTKRIINLARGRQSQRERRNREVAEIISKAKKEVKHPLSLNDYQLIGSALYWAEGNKTKSFEITNSDPHFILFMVRWFEKIFSISPKNLKARLNIYPQQNDRQLKKFWSELTNIPLENFTKSFIKPANKGYKKNNLYYGTIKVRVPKGTDMRYQVFAWIEAMLKDINPDIKLVQERWKSLEKVSRPVNLIEN